MTTSATPRKKDPKFRVIPNLSMRGSDILTRLKNGSLKLDPQGQYTVDEKIDAGRRMSKIEIVDALRENKISIENNKVKLEKLNKPKA